MLPIKIKVPNGFLNEEERCGYVVTIKMKKIWAVELDLLNQLDVVCNKYGLTYYADSGTLLGAVRNNGFIPWDDDIDVIMPRKDYNKLIRKHTKEFKSPYFLQSAYSDDGYFRGHAQLRNSLTTGMLPNEAPIVNFNQGIFLDIFPVDFLPRSKKEIYDKIKRLNTYRKYYDERVYGGKLNTLKDIVYKKMIFMGGGSLSFRRFEKISSEKNGKYIDKVMYYRDYNEFKYIPFESLGKPKYSRFEFLKIPIPCDFDSILKKYYGNNYMIPQNNVSGHHLVGDTIIEPETPYKNILNKMRKLLDADN